MIERSWTTARVERKTGWCHAYRGPGLGLRGHGTKSTRQPQPLRYQREDCRCKKMLAQCRRKARWRYRMRWLVGVSSIGAPRDHRATPSGTGRKATAIRLEGCPRFVVVESKQQKIGDGGVLRTPKTPGCALTQYDMDSVRACKSGRSTARHLDENMPTMPP